MSLMEQSRDVVWNFHPFTDKIRSQISFQDEPLHFIDQVPGSLSFTGVWTLVVTKDVKVSTPQVQNSLTTSDHRPHVGKGPLSRNDCSVTDVDPYSRTVRP